MSKSLPNILIFNPDQWRGDVLGYAGNPAAVTPNLDSMVESDAVAFSHAFCQNPVCTPSRCSFMTGLYPHVRGHRTMHHMLHPEKGDKSLLNVLREQGYFIWWGGKNDLLPGQDGHSSVCDVYFQPCENDYKSWGYTSKPNLHQADSWRGDPGSDNYYSFFAGQLDTGNENVYCDSDWAMVLGAIDLIRSYEGDQPLCIYLPLQYPHPPYGVEEPWFSMIERNKIPSRIPVYQSTEGKPIILEGIREKRNMKGWTEDRWTELRATYYGMCARVDHQFGMVMDALRERGLYDDTAVFFFSDHGDFTGDYGLPEKTENTFEDCLTHVPFIIKPPVGVAAQAGVRDALIELVDFPATIYDMLSVDPEYSHFGKSLLPVVSGKASQHKDAVFCEGGRLMGETQASEIESFRRFEDPTTSLYWPCLVLQVSEEKPYHGKGAMCRTATLKYVRRLYETDELYDLVMDPGECRNVIDDPEYSDRLIQMRERMLTWYQQTCDTVPEKSDKRWFDQRKYE